MKPDVYPPKPTPAPQATERFAGLYFSASARSLLKPGLTPAEFLRALARAELFQDAFIVVVHTLPQRLHVWWVCMCLLRLRGRSEDPKVLHNFSVLVRWIRHPTAARRADVTKLSAGSVQGDPAYWLMLAVAEPEHSPSRVLGAVANVIRLAGDRAGPALYRQMLALAIDVERGVIPLPPPGD